MTTRKTSIGAKVAGRKKRVIQRQKVFAHLLRKGEYGATLQEMEMGIPMPGNTLRPRRKELETRGFVMDSGRKRNTVDGNPAIVWIIPSSIVAKCEPVLAKNDNKISG